jgi:glutamate 5-kinase
VVAADRVVVKAGTNSLTDADSNLDGAKVDRLVDGVAGLLADGREVLVVSSGAIGAGKGRVGYDGRSVEESQALSTIGQGALMHRYTESFERHGRTAAQILVTAQDLERPARRTNVENTVETLLSWGAVPVVNENDAVATEEIRIGDNDMLSASLAVAVGADLLVTLTDVDGVYTGHPEADPDARRIGAVAGNYDAVAGAVAASADREFGGVRTKVEGARRVAEHGTPAVVAGADQPDVLERIAAGDPVGTLFVPVEGERAPAAGETVDRESSPSTDREGGESAASTDRDGGTTPD